MATPLLPKPYIIISSLCLIVDNQSESNYRNLTALFFSEGHTRPPP